MLPPLYLVQLDQQPGDRLHEVGVDV